MNPFGNISNIEVLFIYSLGTKFGTKPDSVKSKTGYILVMKYDNKLSS